MRLVCLLALALFAAIPAAARPACGRGRRTVVILPAPRPFFAAPRWEGECRLRRSARTLAAGAS